MSNAADRLSTALSDRYRLERELGQGGMATVYLAEDLKRARKVAIKVLHPELSAVSGSDRFLTAIKVTASLQHPHILGPTDSGAVPPVPGLSPPDMDQHEGRHLDHILGQRRVISWGQDDPCGSSTSLPV
jgi:serine/threonine protein kinase